MPRSSRWSLSLRSLHQNSVCTSPVSHTFHKPHPARSVLFGHPNNTCSVVQILLLLLSSSSSSSSSSSFSIDSVVKTLLYIYIHIHISLLLVSFPLIIQFYVPIECCYSQPRRSKKLHQTNDKTVHKCRQ